MVPHQTEGSEDRQPLDIRQPQLHQTESDNDAVENVPADLKVVVGVHGDELEEHFRCEDPGENLQVNNSFNLRSERGEFMDRDLSVTWRIFTRFPTESMLSNSGVMG